MKKILIKQVDYEKVYNKVGDIPYSDFKYLMNSADTNIEYKDAYDLWRSFGYNVVATCECNDDADINYLLEDCYKYFNIQHDDTMLSNIEYKCEIVNGLKNMHSLSIGDVVQIDDAEYLCINIGWERIN